MFELDLKNLIRKSIEDHKKSFSYVLTEQFEQKLQESIELVFESIKNEGCIFTCGNGGSFADAQHFTAELVVRYNRHRDPLSSITLGCNSSNLTACSNDFNFDDIFKREYMSQNNESDMLLAISTSGNSKNIRNVLDYAASKNRNWIFLTSDKILDKPKGGIVIEFPFTTTAAVQECHIFYLQLLCRAIDSLLIGPE